MSSALIIAVRDALVGAADDLGITGVHVAGDIPRGARLPYLAIYPLPPITSRLAVEGAWRTRHGVQIDVYAPTLLAALDLGDGIKELITGMDEPASGGRVSSPGLIAEGQWRLLRAPVPTDPQGAAYHQHTLTFVHYEIHTA